jgi:hypothetical protein
MKLRIKGNSVRLRLTRPEVARLRDDGLVEESAGFGEGEALIYRLRCVAAPGPPHAAFRQGTIEVSVSGEAAREWAVGEEVGLYSQAGEFRIAIEKDFHCLTRPIGEEPDAYPHPAVDSCAKS